MVADAVIERPLRLSGRCAVVTRYAVVVLRLSLCCGNRRRLSSALMTASYVNERLRNAHDKHCRRRSWPQLRSDALAAVGNDIHFCVCFMLLPSRLCGLRAK